MEYQYDPNQQPDAKKWLELDESERLDSVGAYHKKKKIKLSNVEGHAAAHTVIETFIANGREAVLQTCDRLIADGLDRHEAIHAICFVFMQLMHESLQNPNYKGDPEKELYEKLSKLTKASWEAST